MYRVTIAQRDRCLPKDVKSSFCLHLPANVPMEKEHAYLSTNVNCLRIFCLRTEDSCRRRRACLRTIVCQCGLGFIIDYDYASMKRRFVDSKPTDILGGKEPRHIFASAAECGDAPKKKGFFKGFWKRSRHYSLENQ